MVALTDIDMEQLPVAEQVTLLAQLMNIPESEAREYVHVGNGALPYREDRMAQDRAVVVSEPTKQS